MGERWALVSKYFSLESVPGCDRVIEMDDIAMTKAYIVDPDAVRYTDLDTGKSWTLREQIEGVIPLYHGHATRI